jgi:hypothetical protein
MFAFDPYLKPLNQTADLLGTELLNPETAAMLACPAMTRPLCLDLCHFLANSVELQLHLAGKYFHQGHLQLTLNLNRCVRVFSEFTQYLCLAATQA